MRPRWIARGRRSAALPAPCPRAGAASEAGAQHGDHQGIGTSSMIWRPIDASTRAQSCVERRRCTAIAGNTRCTSSGSTLRRPSRSAQLWLARSSPIAARGERPAWNAAALARVGDQGLHVVEQRSGDVDAAGGGLQLLQVRSRENRDREWRAACAGPGRAAGRARAGNRDSRARCASGSGRAATPAAERCRPVRSGSAWR